MLINYDN